MKNILQEELQKLEALGLRRSLRTVASIQGREIVLDGRKVLNFCSNDYLGLAGDPRLAAAACAAMAVRGFGAGASRLVGGNFDLHAALEADLAQMKHTEAVLLFSSGYAANTGIIPALAGRSDAVFSDRLNHASIVDGVVLSRAAHHRYPHRDMGALDAMLRKASGSRRRLIVTDTVFSMDGDVAPLVDLARLAQEYDAWLMVDEAHAFGVLGPTGGGLVEATGTGADVHVQMGTLSKAVGAYGAYAAGSASLREYLINTARSFIYTTAMPPGAAAAAGAGLSIMRTESWRRERLKVLSLRLREGLTTLGFDTLPGSTPIIPVMVGDAVRAVALSKALLARGVFIAAIRPPTVPEGQARLRVTVTAGHTDDDISACLEAFAHAR